MWLAFILTFIFGGAILAFCICGIYYIPDYDILEIDDYRHDVLKQPYDNKNLWRDCYKETSKEMQEQYDKYKNKLEIKSKARRISLVCLAICIYIGLICGFCSLGAFLDNESLRKDVASYQASKYTIEQSLQNDKISGLERIELVKLANEKNEWLARTQYDIQQWYRFYLDKDLVLTLEKIDI